MTIPVPILTYHSISEVSTEKFKPWTVTPRMFEAHLAALRDGGYTPLTVTQYVRAIDEGTLGAAGRPALITFDDGFQDFYTHAMPALTRFGFPATVYIVTGAVGGTSRWLAPEGEGDRPMMTWEQVAAIDAQGIECGAHTHSHPQLDVLPPAEAQEEIVRSKDELEQHLGHRIESFAYPHGYFDRRVRALVIEAGYTSACGVKNTLSAPHDDRFALSRFFVMHDTDADRLRDLLQGKGLPAMRTRERIRTRIWRAVRRSEHQVRRALAQTSVGQRSENTAGAL